MRFDVIACAYRNWDKLPFFLWGLEKNAENVNSVTIVQDEIAPLPSLPSHVRGLCQEHNGHGVGRAFNLAAKDATADFILTTSIDLIAAPESLAVFANEVSEGDLAVGQVQTIAESTTLADLDSGPEIIRRDFYEPHIAELEAKGMQWRFARNGFTVYHRPTFVEIGGFDERFSPLGYGNEDYEIALRWQMARGLDSIQYIWGAEAWHFGDAEGGAANTKKIPSAANQALLTERIAEWQHWRSNH